MDAALTQSVRPLVTPNFLTVYLFVDAIAAKRGLKGQRKEDLPRIRDVMREGGYFLLRLAVLIYHLIQGVSPIRVGFIAVLTVFIVSLFRASTRVGPGAWIAALERGAKAALPVGADPGSGAGDGLKADLHGCL